MRRLSPRVNVIPVIGKSDTMTPTELRMFKKRVSLLENLYISYDCRPRHAKKTS